MAGPPAGVTPGAFFEAARASFDRAAARAGCVERAVTLDGSPVLIRVAGGALADRVLPAFAHLDAAPPRTAELAAPRPLVVYCADSATAGETVAAPDWGPLGFGPKCEILAFQGSDVRAVFDPVHRLLHAYDASSATGLFWADSPAAVPWWESSRPLRPILHWWTEGTTRQAVHAGCVGTAGVGVLLAGRSGAGKSTTALACLRGGFEYVGDDFVLADVDRCVAHSMYSTAKLEPRNAARFSELRITEPDRPGAEKVVVQLDRTSVVDRLALRAIVLPEVTGRPGSAVRAASPASALAVLASTTAPQLAGLEAESFVKLGRLVRALPCFVLEAGTDLHQIPVVLADLLEELR